MTTEQKQLLYDIAKWHSDEFYNEMDDHWTSQNFLFARKCRNAISELEKEYKEKYGDLPEWKYINDVWDTMKELEGEII